MLKYIYTHTPKSICQILTSPLALDIGARMDEIGQTIVFSQKDLFKGYPASRVASIFLRAGYLKEGEVWEKSLLNKIIATLITQGLPSSILCRPIA